MDSNNNPLPGVTVVLKGNHNRYHLPISTEPLRSMFLMTRQSWYSALLVMKQQEVKVTERQSTTVIMEEELVALEEGC